MDEERGTCALRTESRPDAAPSGPEKGGAILHQHRDRTPRQSSPERPDRMREILREARLVHEQSTDAKDARDLVQRGDPSREPAADVIAGAEVDDEVEAAAGEWEIATVAHLERGARAGAANPLVRGVDEHGVDVDPRELRGPQSLGEHG